MTRLIDRPNGHYYMVHTSKRLSWVLLLALTLLGVQLLQDSPLHDHSSGAVDCALCHIQFTDHGAAVDSLVPVLARTVPVRVPAITPAYSARIYRPYQGRSPPAASS